MKTVLRIPPHIHERLLKHLLPQPQLTEEAAFVFAEVLEDQEQVVLSFKDWYALTPDDYAVQSAYFIELTDRTRASIIKRAHDLGTALVEFHSHIDQEFASFSGSDLLGFSEFVPHIFWRLGGKPYGAVVVTTQGFDALVWLTDPKQPGQLDILQTGSTLLKPTNNTLTHGKRGR